MNRTTVFLVAIVCTVMCFAAPKEKLKFMGIPMNTTIGVFQKKLCVKGCKLSSDNKYAPKGQRIFMGTFAGTECQIIVWYTPSNKKVYRVKAMNKNYSDERVKSVYEEFKAMFISKYEDNSVIIPDTQDGYPSMTIYVYGEKDKEVIGRIDLFISTNTYTFPTEYLLHIDYHDEDANEADRRYRMDDI